MLTHASRPSLSRTPYPSSEAKRQKVRLPWRLVSDPTYDDTALEVYTKVAALALRPEGCTASVATLALYLGCSTGKVERGLQQLMTPHPISQNVELTSRRRTLPGGRGTTAIRRVRPHRSDENFVWIPTALVGAVTGRQLRAYAVISYAHVRKLPLATQDLRSILIHRDGSPVSSRTVRNDVRALADAGWLTLGPREGLHGRHSYVPNTDLTPPTCPAPRRPGATGGGSGGATGGGSLAYKESPRTPVDQEERTTVVQPAEGEVPAVAREAAVENPGVRAGGDHAEPKAQPSIAASREASSRITAYSGPSLLLSPRVAQVLEPIRPLYQRANPYVQRRMAREIGRQLDTGEATVERLRDRVERRRASTPPQDSSRAEGWLLGLALAKWGCQHIDCESGTMWSTGSDCATCCEARAERRTQQHRPDVTGVQTAARLGDSKPLSSRAAAPVAKAQGWSCPVCERPGTGRAPASGRCRDCRHEQDDLAGDPLAEASPPMPRWTDEPSTSRGGRVSDGEPVRAPYGHAQKSRTQGVSQPRRAGCG